MEVCDTPYTATSAPYFYARGLQYAKMGEYRKAMVDLLRYEYFNQGRLGADFYYQREQIELQGKLYQQALGDILTACRLAPEEVSCRGGQSLPPRQPSAGCCRSRKILHQDQSRLR